MTQCFTCSTFRISELRDNEVVDLPAVYRARRPIIFGAFVVLDLVAMFQNWRDRNNMAGLSPNDWIGEELTGLPMGVAILVAGWARPHWLQWAAVAVMASF